MGKQQKTVRLKSGLRLRIEKHGKNFCRPILISQSPDLAYFMFDNSVKYLDGTQSWCSETGGQIELRSPDDESNGYLGELQTTIFVASKGWTIEMHSTSRYTTRILFMRKKK